MTEPARPVRRRLPIVAAIALSVGLAAILLLVGLYAARRQIAREAVTAWLRDRGIASESQFQELGPGRLVGRLRVGSAAAPDLTVEQAEVRYSLGGLLGGRGVQVTSIRLVRPVLRARWQGGRVSAGALDPLIEEFRKRPPQPGAPSPRIEVRDGRLQLATDYGLVQARADALVDNGRLTRLDASTAPTRLAGRGYAAELGTAQVAAQARGERLTLSVRAPFVRIAGPQLSAGAGVLTLASDTSYPDFPRAAVATGQATAQLEAAMVGASSVTIAQVHLRAASSRLQWARAGAGDRLSGDIRLAADIHGLVAADLRLASAASDLAGDFAVGGPAALRLSGDAEGRGAWTGLGTPVAGDSREIVAIKRGLKAFRASAQGVKVAASGDGVRLGLSGPARLLLGGGGEVRLTPQGPGWRLTSSGGGLPEAEARVRRFALADGGATAQGVVRAALSIGPVQDAVFDAAGTLRIADGAASFLAERCADVKAARLDLGQNDVERISARLCPAGGPLLRVGGAGWTVQGRAQAVSAAAPFLQADVADGAARLRLEDAGGRLSGEIGVETARVRDTAAEERFRPLLMSGQVGLVRDVWSGALDFRLPNGPQVARAALRHDGRTGAGSVEVSTGTLQFAAGGLQPADLSPIAAPLAPPVTGAVEFDGGFRWTTAGATGGGRLRIPGLDFKGPVGAVRGLSGEIEFTSLAPLIAPPGQILHAQRVAAALPLTDLTASLALTEKALVVSGGRASAGGGLVRIERLEVPLDKSGRIEGALQLDGVQLHDLIAASPFGDRVDLDARVSGRIPFQSQGGRVQISGGELHAISPGRLSVSRAALTSVSAQGSVDAPAPVAGQVGDTDTFTDFAYQALENLAFDKLDAGVATRSDGRLGVMFHIVGRHDPPQHQEITLSWWDLIRRKFLDRKLPLPSGTGVDLTLDTTLNLDDLLKDYADFERLRSSPPVQR